MIRLARLLLVFFCFGCAAWAWAAPPAQSEKPYINVQVLKGLSSADFIDAMRFMADSLGVFCNHCHVTRPQGNWPMELDDKETKRTTRKMIEMTRAINRDNFGGKLTVTCATCHRGQAKPAAIPPLRVLGEMARPTVAKTVGSNPTPDQVLERYVKSLGGSASLEKFQTRLAKGTVVTEQGRSFPLEIIQKRPDKYLLTITISKGAERHGFDGASAWGAGPANVWTMQGLERDRIRRAAEYYPAVTLKQQYPELSRTGTEKIGDREALVIEARGAPKTYEKLFFDSDAGLLVRRIVFHQTILGDFPEQTDYGDYREVEGVKLPFLVKRMEINTRWTETYSEIKHGLPLDDARFEKPAKSDK